MTKTAIENAKLETQKEMQEKQLEHEKSENKKDRRSRFASSILSAALGAGGRIASKAVGNDASWYKQYISNIALFGNLPTFTALGIPGYNHSLFGANGTNKYGIPGICILWYDSSIGSQPSTSFTGIRDNPVNQILMRTKSQILKLNSRSSVSWEAADLGLNVLATAEILTAILELRRAIECYYTYSATNRYLGERMITALGFTYSDMAAHISEYEKTYEILRKRFNTDLVAPKEITLFERKKFLAENVFADSPSTRAQLYVYVKRSGYLTLNNAGDALNLTTFSKATYSTYKTAVATAISNLAENPDFIEMYADLRHAIANGKLTTLELEPMGKEISIVYNQEVITQIENITTLPNDATVTWTPDGLDVFSCANGYLYQGKSVTTTSTDGKGMSYVTTNTGFNNIISKLNTAYDEFLYRFTDATNNVDGALVNSRLMIYPEFETFSPSSGVTNMRAKLVHCGTEVITHCSYISTYWNGVSITNDATYAGTVFITASPSVHAKVAGVISKFSWHPIVNACDVTMSFSYPLGDIDRYYVMSEQNLEGLHECAVTSEFFLNVKDWNAEGATS